MILTKERKTMSYRIKQIVVAGLVYGVGYYALKLYRDKNHE